MNPDDFELEQYRALRDEILRAMEDGNGIMSFGLAAIGLIMTAAIDQRANVLGFLFFAVLIPGLAMLVLSLWFAAAERVARASHFLSGVEARVAPGAVTWERWLRGGTATKRSHFWNSEYSGLAIFLVLTVAPLAFSLSTGGPHVQTGWRVATMVAVGLAMTDFCRRFLRRMVQWRSWLTTTFGDGV